jgi:N,N-dimethylformamidase
MSTENKLYTKHIVGYSDKISISPGNNISFMVSSEDNAKYDTSFVRIIHGDTNPKGPGYKIQSVSTEIDGTYVGQQQECLCGSFVTVSNTTILNRLESFTVQAMIWPTTPEKGVQSIVSHWNDSDNSGFILGIDSNGAISFRIGDGSGKVQQVSTGAQLVAREWYLAAASFDAASGEARVLQDPQVDYAKCEDRASSSATFSGNVGNTNSPILIAACYVEHVGSRIRAAEYYNGKIDSPAITSGVLDRLQMEQLLERNLPGTLQKNIIAHWDFGIGMKETTTYDISPNQLNGELVNMPTRGMKGPNWSGQEMNWANAQHEYGAIHFHDDDVYDAGWNVDFTLMVPDSWKSGLYAAHVQVGEHEDYIPFVVRAKSSVSSSARAVFLVPTASYMSYANHRCGTDAPIAQLLAGRLAVLDTEDIFLLQNRNYGGSQYDTHSDDSGVSYSSRLRPILNMRPNYQSWMGGAGSSLWQFNADTHIIDWLEAKGFDCDCITDEDLHYEGVAALEGYDVVLTGSHPEYWSTPMWQGLDAFKQRGGRLMYLGANGFYWHVAYHETAPGIMEVRRAEDGIRAWAAEPGEYYHSFTGEYGGLWRRKGKPPQMMAGTGFSAQGFDISSYYRRLPESHNERAKFIFEGVRDEIIGDFGLIGDGAAGLELDRADRLLGTPPNCLVLASSENHSDIYLVVCEEILVNYPGLSGQENELVRADMVFYETVAGGAVFSSSSIAWAGSLSHNDYDNNVSKITENVLRRFLDPTPF